jgi:hypothetical protein
MAIKVTLGATENTQQEKPFPKLMISTTHGKRIVFATGEHNGGFYEVLRVSGFGSDIDGTMSKSFSLFEKRHQFTDYNEPITIQNA